MTATVKRVRALALPAVDAPLSPGLPEAAAIKALAAGKASEHQQQLAWNLIVRGCSGVQLPSFRGGGDALGMAFMEGRRFVGSQLLSIASIDTSRMKDDA